MGILIRRCLSVLLVGFTGVSFSNNMRPFGFSFNPASGVSNRLVTPNGDGKNDAVLFTFSNPRDSDVSGYVYDAKGMFVASMSAAVDSSGNPALQWDGKAGGGSAAGGIYIYVIIAESQAYSGSVVVIR